MKLFTITANRIRYSLALNYDQRLIIFLQVGSAELLHDLKERIDDELRRLVCYIVDVLDQALITVEVAGDIAGFAEPISGNHEYIARTEGDAVSSDRLSGKTPIGGPSAFSMRA